MQRPPVFSLSALLIVVALCGLGCDISDPPGTDSSENGDNGMTNGENGNSDDTDTSPELAVQQEPFGETPAGEAVERFLLSNEKGMVVSIMTYGAIVTSVEVPDKEGNVANVTLGFDSLDGYADAENKDPYFGAIVGRYANRIAAGKFSIGDNQYTLAINNKPNHLHGGVVGFNDVVWVARVADTENDDSVAIELTYVSADGEEGYPGELKSTVLYTLNNNNELRIEYTATSDKATPINLTNHCYWNLAGVTDGEGTQQILDHVLTLPCDNYLPVDETLIPTGDMNAVADTPMDFTKPMAIASRFSEVKGDDENGGYDHCYVIDGWDESLRLAARVREPNSGRVMEILTTEPGIQLYTGNFLDGEPANGNFAQHTAFCLEAQHFPDSPNQPDFPTTVYGPGEVYKQTTVHRFSVEE
ncbi:MAG: galactose mutarotase [Planctomycetaceae bacterium]|jgi:aldose 1-epimerase|nr:galactose mutarotase [Planctomycetaceae bacterium]MBT6157110.1 galactose mutarotase [Planctomycetaceae bacterium]MBT6487170.1 galactose mutarotase [Planctomycetaceae bacterium]MBT6497773.1 galactose mutarotase [Planctomycetaceae bacterium]